MRRYRILHRTYYNFSTVVRIHAHQLRLRPIESHEVRLESFKLDIQPQAVVRWQRDAEGNSVAIATFEQAASQLAIASEAVLQQHNENPFDFIVADYAMRYPFRYDADDEIVLAPYRSCTQALPGSQLSQWLARIRPPEDGCETYAALHALNRLIGQTLSYRVREEAGVQSAEATLASGTGSCRDYAALFMESARHLGLAARFVSGYLRTPPTPGAYGSTHAWAEVYVPGAGWKGFDPTLGVMAAHDHVAIAVARLPESVPPIAGAIAGPATTTLDVGVWVTAL